MKVFADARKVLAQVFLRSRLSSIDGRVVERFANEFHNLIGKQRKVALGGYVNDRPKSKDLEIRTSDCKLKFPT